MCCVCGAWALPACWTEACARGESAVAIVVAAAGAALFACGGVAMGLAWGVVNSVNELERPEVSCSACAWSVSNENMS